MRRNERSTVDLIGGELIDIMPYTGSPIDCLKIGRKKFRQTCSRRDLLAMAFSEGTT